MHPDVEARLLQLNRAFYQSFAEEFAASRARPQPGVLKLVTNLPPHTSVLDLGCGHGLVAQQLAAQGHQGRYVGIDANPQLLAMAREHSPPFPAKFLQHDLAEEDWAQGVPGTFDAVFAFAVLHHLPGQGRRRRFAENSARHVAPGGQMTVSVWDFLASERLRSRLVSWTELGMDPDEVEAGDYLIDWRRGGYGIRYVHHFDADELDELAHSAGLRVAEQFHSDGENGRLGLYQVWQPVGS